MNKLILIGNGFDLAHGLPTSYTNLLNYFWLFLPENINAPEIKEILYINPNYSKCLSFSENNEVIKNFKDFKLSVSLYFNSDYYKNIKAENLGIKLYNGEFLIYEFKNHFFYILNQYFEEHNWVDIENLYYEILVSFINKEENKYKYKGDIISLNKEFYTIKKFLEAYLYKEVISNRKFIFTKRNEPILELFKNNIHNLGDKIKRKINDPYFYEFPYEDRLELIEIDDELLKQINESNPTTNELLFLDFNYTNTVDTYAKTLNSFKTPLYPRATQISIHGKINDHVNPINFGFGDEMDDHYKLIENTNDNNYLENIKSFMYLNNSNYKKLLNWINNSKFQVFIMGHSCGLSDRTMLNTIFEHHNCRSIKVFYYERNGKDNFKEITQNISRHFNKKTLMREKLVDKSLSCPLPQEGGFDYHLYPLY
ncbi:AbiH family protein [Elizabethkingia ursingii]|jgi:hypothetical protein|uniref:Bacteriophage abortive infection AbiH n=1 Tax=Elizabethkingia ursingii TaxID=1756150 RepID=A0AAJ3NAS1_9FLAO|nr:AbiH family protein [Elizabethkingia ursingii]AQX07949.1 hypothetical protein BBD34_04510 [Elizabethkingia ursingii]OPB73698.1 hypothetical protein BAY32_11715 [Elizabethkingia ursingii]OPB88726.1 hypothetical protein BB021_04930 [Elizabethkingia ursingii]